MTKSRQPTLGKFGPAIVRAEGKMPDFAIPRLLGNFVEFVILVPNVAVCHLFLISRDPKGSALAPRSPSGRG